MQDVDPRRFRDATGEDLKGTDRLSRLRRANEEPWRPFLLRIAIQTAAVLAVTAVVLFVVSIVVK